MVHIKIRYYISAKDALAHGETCHGEGELTLMPEDVRKLSPVARDLVAKGVCIQTPSLAALPEALAEAATALAAKELGVGCAAVAAAARSATVDVSELVASWSPNRFGDVPPWRLDEARTWVAAEEARRKAAEQERRDSYVEQERLKTISAECANLFDGVALAATVAPVLAWIEAHGSERLKAGIRRGHDMAKLIRKEVADRATARTTVACWDAKPRDMPSAEALALLDETEKNVESSDWQPKDWVRVDPMVHRADIEEGPDTGDYRTGILLVVDIPGDEEGECARFICCDK